MNKVEEMIERLRAAGYEITQEVLVNAIFAGDLTMLEGTFRTGGVLPVAEEEGEKVKGLHYIRILLRDMRSKLENDESLISFGEQDVEEIEALILSVCDLKLVKSNYDVLQRELTELQQFKRVAEMHLTEDQIDAIDADIENEVWADEGAVL